LSGLGAGPAVRGGRISADAGSLFSGVLCKVDRSELVWVLVKLDCIAVLAERANLVPVVHTCVKCHGCWPLLARSALGRTSRPALGLPPQPPRVLLHSPCDRFGAGLFALGRLFCTLAVGPSRTICDSTQSRAAVRRLLFGRSRGWS